MLREELKKAFIEYKEMMVVNGFKFYHYIILGVLLLIAYFGLIGFINLAIQIKLKFF